MILILLGVSISNAQFLLQAPTGNGENNYQWFEASDTTSVLGTNSFYEAIQPGVYFATYDGTLCGTNATGYFIVTNCDSPDNEVILDVTPNVTGGIAINWNNPSLTGTQPMVIATQTVERYVATLTKAGNTINLPRFTVVCMQQAADLQDDMVVVNEDQSIDIPIYDNDANLPTNGNLITSQPTNGVVVLNNNGTPNDPSDDRVTYTPNTDYNGSDGFDYTICNAMGDCSTATVAINVLPIVDALDDSVSTEENTTVVINILANDNDLPNIGTLMLTSPSNGSVTIANNSTSNDPSDDFVIYIPDTGFAGTDTFDYTTCDDMGNCSTAMVTVVIANMIDLDADNDGIVNVFEDLNLDNDNNPATLPTDTDTDGIPDYLDIDSDNDGIPDNVEAQISIGYVLPSGIDANVNGLDDTYETNGNLGLIPIDTDGDGLPDYVDEDSDNDFVPDNVEGNDFNQDGLPDEVYVIIDQDNDGLSDGYEGGILTDIDVNDEINDPLTDLPDTDGDGLPNYRDTDDDNDGIETIDEDENEDGNPSNDDNDDDGTPNYLDSDLDASDTDIEVFNVITPNGDGVHDELRIRNIENFPNNTVKIYNRWGVMVFSTKDYNSVGNVFDGTSQARATVNRNNGLPAGTYFYIIDYEDQSGIMRQKTGYLYINR